MKKERREKKSLKQNQKGAFAFCDLVLANSGLRAACFLLSSGFLFNGYELRSDRYYLLKRTVIKTMSSECTLETTAQSEPLISVERRVIELRAGRSSNRLVFSLITHL